MIIKEYVVFDIDGVLCDFVSGYSAIANQLFGYPQIDTSAQVSWKWDESQGYSSKEIDDIWRHIDESKTFWQDLSPLATSEDRDQMRKLSSRYQILYCTNRRGETVYRQTMTWLGNHGFPLAPVIVTEKKIQELYSLRKWIKSCIDDRPSLLEEYRDNKFNVYAMCWKYNEHVENVPRVHSVKEFCEKNAI